MPEVASWSLEVDDTTFTENAKKFLTDIGKAEKDFVREQSSLLARDLGKYTPPYAGKQLPPTNRKKIATAKDIAAGKGAVDAGIRSICQKRNKRKTINNFIKEYGGGGPIIRNGIQIAPRVIDDMDTLRNWHYMNRTKWGRTKRLAYSMRPIVHKTLLNKYIKHRQLDVGISKAAFYRSSLQLGGPHNEVKQVKNGLRMMLGTGKLKKNKEGYQGIITGRAPGVYHTIAKIPAIQTNRNKQALARLKILANAQAKKAKLNDA